jgi:phosphoribosylformylglycinamidine cyclo-ligase
MTRLLLAEVVAQFVGVWGAAGVRRRRAGTPARAACCTPIRAHVDAAPAAWYRHPPMAEPRAPLTYRDAGVDIDAGNEAVRRIRAKVASTRRPEQIGDIGGFAGLMGLPRGLREPVLVSSTDGVGTKLLVAIAAGRHDTVGIDLVAMVVNDLIVTGAEPLFLLDYVATGRLDPAIVEAIVGGIADGCREAGCALLGGETAELPGMYADGHYDLAAFAVGVVDRDALWDPSRTAAGDVAIALPSSGLHSNGYSLARRALLDPAHAGLRLDDPLPGAPDLQVLDALLTPTRIYVRALAAAAGPRDAGPSAVRSASHITGGGLIENPPRAYRDELALRLDLRAIARPPVFAAIAAQGVPELELRRTFNCGIGMLLFVDRERSDEVVARLRAAGEAPALVGELVARGDGPAVQFVGDADSASAPR